MICYSRGLFISVLLLLFGAVVGPLHGAAPELEAVLAKTSEALARAEAAHPAKAEEINTKYLAALKRLEAETQKKGELRTLLLVRDDIQVFEEKKEIGKGDSFAQLDFLRDAYLKQVHRLQQTRLEERVAQREAQVQALDALLRKLTRENKIPEALEVEKALKEAAAPLSLAKGELAAWKEVLLFETLAKLKEGVTPKMVEPTEAESPAKPEPEAPSAAPSNGPARSLAVPLPPRPTVFPLPTAKLVAWGQNDYGQTDIPADLREVADVTSGWMFAMALTKDGKIRGWGGKAQEAKKFKGTSPLVLNPPADLPRAVAVAAGRAHAAALLPDGSVRVWGDYDEVKNLPKGLADVRVLKSGGNFIAALQGDRRLFIWGSRKMDDQVVENVFDFAVAYEHVLVLTMDGRIQLFGKHSSGSGAEDIPKFDEAPAAIAASFEGSFVMGRSGRITVWGGGTNSLRDAPRGPFISMHAGSSFGIGIKSDGTLHPWGENDKGQFPPQGLRGVVRIATLKEAVFALIAEPAPGEGFVETWRRWNPRSVILR